MISIESAAVPLYPAGSECTQKDTGAPGGSRLPRSKCTRGMARWVWLARWAGHRLELTATSPWIDSCTPVGKARCRPGKSRSCDGQGRRSRYTTDDARPDLAQTNDPVLDKRKLESVRLDPLAWEARSRPEGGPQKQAAKKRSRVYCVHRSTACKDGATPRGTRTFKAAIWIPLSASYSPQGSAAGMTTSSTRLQTAPNLCKI